MELIRAAHSSAFSVEIYQVLPHQALSLHVGDSLQLFYFFWSLSGQLRMSKVNNWSQSQQPLQTSNLVIVGYFFLCFLLFFFFKLNKYTFKIFI